VARILFHFHAKMPTLTGNCATNQHHADCSLGPLTPANENACNQRGKTPMGRPCRCEHEVPEPIIGSEVPGELQLWEEPALQADRKSKKSRSSKKRAKKR